jgi:effector-binding domain-containing protein
MDDIHVIDVLAQGTVGIRRVVPTDSLAEVFPELLERVAAALAAAGASSAGPPYARYRNMTGATVDVEVGFPVEVAPAAGGDVLAGELPPGRVVEAVHVGPYDALSGTYQRIEAWVREHGLELGTQSWEIYEAGPMSDPDPGTWRTRIVWPLTGPPLEAGGPEH